VILDRSELLEALPKDGIVAELGVDQGNYSGEIISRNRPKKLYLIDVWNTARYPEEKYLEVKEKFRKEIASGAVEIIRADSIEAMTSFPDKFFDWVYVDTNHKYEQTLKELEISGQKVKGFLVGHDFCAGNVKKGLQYGVIPAVRDFCDRNDWEIRYLTLEKCMHCSYALGKIKKSGERNAILD